MKKYISLFLVFCMCLSIASCSNDISNETTDPPKESNVFDLEEAPDEIIGDVRSIEKIDISITSQHIMTLFADNYRDMEYIEMVTDFFTSLSLSSLGGTSREIPDHIPADFIIGYADASEVRIMYDNKEHILYRYAEKDADYCVAYKIQPPIKSPLDFASDLISKKIKYDKEHAEKTSEVVSATIIDEHIVFSEQEIVSIVIARDAIGEEIGSGYYSMVTNTIRYEMNSDIERIKAFFQELVLKKEESDYPSQLSGEPTEICFFFDNETRIKMYVVTSMRSVYLKINADYYDIGREQYEALLDTINWHV